MNVWIRRRPNITSRIRLFCFPHAGGGASLFARWPRVASPDLEICRFQLPGHEDRIKEATTTDLSTLLDGVIGAMADCLDKPYALFGHSFGAQLAFHLASALPARQMPSPVHVFVSGSTAPGIRLSPLLSAMADSEFLSYIGRWYGWISPALLAEPELVTAVLRNLRADFQLFDQMAARSAPPLDMSISAFGGQSDRTVLRSDLELWATHTRREFRLQMFEGDHFYLRGAEPALLQSISQDLEPYVRNCVNRQER